MKKLLKLFVPVILFVAFLLPNTMLAAGEWRSEHPTQLILTETTAIYNNPFDDPSQKIAELTPQTVTVTGAYLPKGYEIETWLGKKWIFTTDKTKAIPHGPSFTPKKFKLFDAFNHLYNVPTDNGWTEAAIGPQIVEIIDSANGFYKVSTWLGEKWIKKPPLENSYAMTELSQIQKIDEQVKITTPTNLYNGPSLGEVTGNAIAPQTVQAFEKIGNWYHIKSNWVGDAWVRVGGVSWSAIQPTKADEVINLTKETDFFATPVSSGLWGKLAPQQVKAFEKWGNYYHIHAWLGDVWISAN